MYSSSNFESDLINSYAWDTAIVFIQEFSGDTNYSMQVGINTEEEIQKCGESILSEVDSGDEAQDIRCNIYDMAGNTYEWSTETFASTASSRIYRGGNDFYTYAYTSNREVTSGGSNKSISCRPTLYL